MKQTILLAIITALVGAAHPAHATQGQETMTKARQTQQSMTKEQAMEQRQTRLTNRFQQCMNDPECSLEERFGLMTEIENELRQATRTLHQTCEDVDYTNCIAPQAEARRTWRNMYSHLGDIMGTIDPAFKTARTIDSKMDHMGKTMGEKEPAAGESAPQKTEEEKSWWDNLWNRGDNRQEQQ